MGKDLRAHLKKTLVHTRKCKRPPNSSHFWPLVHVSPSSSAREHVSQGQSQNHHDSSAPGIQPPDHTANPEHHRSVPLYFHPTLGHSSRKGSIAVARASPSSLTTGTRQRNHMHPHSFRRSSTISSDEHTNTQTQTKKPDRRKRKETKP